MIVLTKLGKLITSNYKIILAVVSGVVITSMIKKKPSVSSVNNAVAASGGVEMRTDIAEVLTANNISLGLGRVGARRAAQSLVGSRGSIFSSEGRAQNREIRELARTLRA